MTEPQKKKNVASNNPGILEYLIGLAITFPIMCFAITSLVPRILDLRVRLEGKEVCSSIPENTQRLIHPPLPEITITFANVEPLSVQNTSQVELLDQNPKASQGGRPLTSYSPHFLLQNPDNEYRIYIRERASYPSRVYLCNPVGDILDGYEIGETPEVWQSPNYRYFAIYKNGFRIYDETLRRITTIDDIAVFSALLAFHPTEPLLAIFDSPNQQIAIWNVETGNEIVRLDYPTVQLGVLTFNTDGTLLYAHNPNEDTARLWGIPSEP